MYSIVSASLAHDAIKANIQPSNKMSETMEKMQWEMNTAWRDLAESNLAHSSAF